MTLEIINYSITQKKPKIVMLDFDNCLYDYEPVHEFAIKEAEKKLIRTLGISQNIFKETYKKSKENIKSRLGEVGSSHSRLLYFQNMIELLCFKTDVALSLDLEQTYWRSFLSQMRLFDKVEDFLIKLRSLDITLIMITDLTSQIQFRKLLYLGIDHYFDYVITSEEAGADKIGLKPYELAKEKLSINNENIWMIGDSLSDIKYSKETFSNLFSIQKIHGNCNNIFPQADAVFRDFNDLILFLEKLYAE